MTKWQKASGGVNRLKHPIFLRNEGVEGAMSNWHAFLLVES